jgi:hypothetical protein
MNPRRRGLQAARQQPGAGGIDTLHLQITDEFLVSHPTPYRYSLCSMHSSVRNSHRTWEGSEAMYGVWLYGVLRTGGSQGGTPYSMEYGVQKRRRS